MVEVKKGDLVRIEYTGRLSSNGMVFDTTSESAAREAGIFQQEKLYGPKLAAFGTNTVMVGLEEAIISSKIGQEEEFTLAPEKAFGNRDPSLVRVMGTKEFARQEVPLFPGMFVQLDGRQARVKSVSPGRVMVDFNPILAGETVQYLLKVSEVITDPKKKIEALLASLSLSGEIKENGKGLMVSFKKGEDVRKIEAAQNVIEKILPGTSFKTS